MFVIDLILVASQSMATKRRESSKKWNAEMDRRRHEDELIHRLIREQERARRRRINGR